MNKYVVYSWSKRSRTLRSHRVTNGIHGSIKPMSSSYNWTNCVLFECGEGFLRTYFFGGVYLLAQKNF